MTTKSLYLAITVTMAFGLISGCAPRATPVQAQTGDDRSVSGTASVIDGDTVEIRGRRVQVYGIEAPERGEPGYEEAAEFMRGLTETGPFVCAFLDEDGGDGDLALCAFISRGVPEDVAKELLQKGFVRTYPKHRDLEPDMFALQEAYESMAKRRCEGLWRETPECQ